MVQGELKLRQLIVSAVITCISNVFQQFVFINILLAQKRNWVFEILEKELIGNTNARTEIKYSFMIISENSVNFATQYKIRVENM